MVEGAAYVTSKLVTRKTALENVGAALGALHAHLDAASSFLDVRERTYLSPPRSWRRTSSSGSSSSASREGARRDDRDGDRARPRRRGPLGAPSPGSAPHAGPPRDGPAEIDGASVVQAMRRAPRRRGS